MKKLLLLGTTVGLLCAATPLRAHGVSFSIGLPAVSVRIGLPPPVYVAPPPVYVAPPPVYYAPPAYYAPPPRVIVAPPVCAPHVVVVKPRHHHHRHCHPRICF